VLKGLKELRVSIQVLLVHLDHKGQRELKEHHFHQRQLVLRDHQELRELFKVLRELLALLVFKVIKGLWGHKGLKDLQVELDPRVLKVLKDFREQQDPKDLLQIKDIREMLHH
jgi:hypothetical protein